MRSIQFCEHCGAVEKDGLSYSYISKVSVHTHSLQPSEVTALNIMLCSNCLDQMIPQLKRYFSRMKEFKASLKVMRIEEEEVKEEEADVMPKTIGGAWNKE